jgi:nucleotide-binding universal stress UspA family protein
MNQHRLFPRIVVPVDGSSLSFTAIAAAGELAGRVDVPVTLFGITYNESDREILEKDLRSLVDSKYRDLAVEILVEAVGAVMTVGGYIANTIVDEAERDGALVCMASHGHSGLGAALLGSTTEEVLSRSTRPMVVVGPQFKPTPIGNDARLVVSVDGSSTSERAVPFAGEWSSMLRLPMWVVQVADPSGPPPEIASRGDAFETSYVKHLAEQHPHGEFDVLHSRHPARELADLTSRWPVALLVMATHGRSGWSRVALGSVAMSVVHHATCAVLVVPAGIEPRS